MANQRVGLRSPCAPLCSLRVSSHSLCISLRSPAFPRAPLAHPSHSLMLPLHSLALTVLPHTPLHAPSHSLAHSLALPCTPPHTPPALPCTDPALPSTSSYAPISRPNCTLSPCTLVSRRIRVKAGGGKGNDRSCWSKGGRGKGESKYMSQR